MADLLPGKRIVELPFASDAIGAEMPAVRSGLNVRVRGGDPHGFATLDSDGRLPSAQSPAALGGYKTLKQAFGASGDDAHNETPHLEAAIDSGETFIATPGIYRINSPVMKTLAANQRIIMMGGAHFRVMDGLGLKITAAGVGAGVEGLSFIGTGRTDDRIGLQLADMDMANVQRCRFTDLETGIDHLPKTRKAWYSGLEHYPGSSIRDSVFRGCGMSINLRDLAEYVTVSGNEMFDCDVAFYAEAGNFRFVNNTLSGCRIGPWIKGGGTNPDHGTIALNTINHIGQVGILLDGIQLAMLIQGNQVWATANAVPWPDYGRNYGMFMRDSRRIVSRGNIFSNTTYPLGFDGLVDSSFHDHVDDTAAPINRYFICEGHGSFGFNRNLDIQMSPTNSAAVTNVVQNYAGFNNSNFRVRTASLAHGVTLDNTVLIDYIHDGRQDQVVGVGGYANNILIPNFRKGTDFEIMVLTAYSNPITVQLPAGTTGFSAAPGAAVAGTTVTLKGNRVRYRFTSTASESGWIITASGGEVAPLRTAGAGTAYQLTTTVAEILFGTTSPSIVITEPGTYLIRATIQVDSAAATVGTTQSLDWRIRRTNNTAVNIESAVIDLKAQTTATHTVGSYVLEALYTTNNATDIVSLFAGLSAALGAGTMSVVKATITATKQY